MHPIVAEDARDQDDMVERACRLIFRDGFARSGQRVIIVAGVPLGTPEFWQAQLDREQRTQAPWARQAARGQRQGRRRLLR